MRTIGVIGAGSFGTAIANVLGASAPEGELSVLLWGKEPEHIAELKATRRNETYLPGVPLNPAIVPIADFSDFKGVEMLFVVTPSKAIRGVAERLKVLCAEAPGVKRVLVSCTKGIEQGTGLRMSEVLAEYVPDATIAVLSGPSHAEEAALGMPGAVVVGCSDRGVAAEVQTLIAGQTFRVYTSGDVAGIELGGALKNVFAIAAGVGDGLGFGDNSKAALLTRALKEFERLGVAMGGRRETFYGLGGLGDLIVTCFSRHSRNRSLGERVGKGESLEQISQSMPMVAEGVPTTRSAYECARRLGVETPVIDAVYALLYEGKAPRVVLAEMLAREPKAED